MSSLRSAVLRAQKLKTHLLTQSSKVLPLKPGVGQNIALHAQATAIDFFLELMSTFPVESAFSFLSFNFSRGFPVLAVANRGSSIDSQNKS